MCLGVPGRVIEIENGNAIIDVMGATTHTSIELLKNVKIGDYVMTHAGCAIEILDEEEALKTIEIFNELKELCDNTICLPKDKGE